MPAWQLLRHPRSRRHDPGAPPLRRRRRPPRPRLPLRPLLSHPPPTRPIPHRMAFPAISVLMAACIHTSSAPKIRTPMPRPARRPIPHRMAFPAISVLMAVCIRFCSAPKIRTPMPRPARRPIPHRMAFPAISVLMAVCIRFCSAQKTLRRRLQPLPRTDRRPPGRAEPARALKPLFGQLNRITTPGSDTAPNLGNPSLRGMDARRWAVTSSATDREDSLKRLFVDHDPAFGPRRLAHIRRQSCSRNGRRATTLRRLIRVRHGRTADPRCMKLWYRACASSAPRSVYCLVRVSPY